MKQHTIFSLVVERKCVLMLRQSATLGAMRTRPPSANCLVSALSIQARGAVAIAFASLLVGCSGVPVDSNDRTATNPNTPDPNNLSSAFCPAANGGLLIDGEKRFLSGMNYAWLDFAADFGGIAGWSQAGVASRTTEHAKNLATMRSQGASVVRWWMLPDFRSDAVLFDGNDKPAGLGGTATKDLEDALRLADEADVYLMLCVFSFDAFFPTKDVGGQKVRSISPIVRDASARTMLIDDVVRPLARVARGSPYAHRVIGWDVINEPEWAMTGSSPYGDPNYDAMPGIDPVTHTEMETFVRDVTKALHEETNAWVTVGSAAVKWGNAWKNVDIDFYQPHVYDWIDQYWPYDNPPSAYGLDDKPVVIGEFPVEGLSSASLDTMLDTLYEVGYAGAMPWDFHLANAGQFSTIAAFASSHGCAEAKPAIPPEPDPNCVDVAPDTTYTCEQQAGWGKCGEPWMQGFCNKSCGRCT